MGAHWIADRLDTDASTAREWLRVGRDLEGLPEIDAAWKERRLSYTKVRVLTRHATAENEVELIERAVAASASQINLAIAAWLAGNETPDETERRQDEVQSLRWRLDADGMYTFTLRAAPYAAASLIAGVDQGVLRRQKESARLAREWGRWPSFARQRFDAFTELVTGGGSDLVTEVVVHVRGDGCSLDDGTPISENTVANLIGESFIRALIHDAQRWPINASGRQRHPTDRQKRVQHERHEGRCVGCGATELLEYHHDPEWELTHRTVIDELQPDCPTCHHHKHNRQE